MEYKELPSGSNKGVVDMVKVTWYKKDMETVQAGLEMLKETCNQVLHDEGSTAKEREEAEQEIVRCIDLSQHVDWIMNGEVEPGIQVDLSRDADRS